MTLSRGDQQDSTYYYTYSQPLLLHGVINRLITPAAAAAWGAHMAAQAQAAAAAQTAAATPTQTP